MQFWSKRQHKGTNGDYEAPFPEDAELRSPIPLPADTLLDKDALLSADQQLQHWLDEAYRDFVKSGGADQLPGKGKPLKIPEGGILETILKNANVPPPWILLRQEIQASLDQAVYLLRKRPEDPEIDVLLRGINEKIVELNLSSPSVSLHRRKITRDNWAEQYKKWK